MRRLQTAAASSALLLMLGSPGVHAQGGDLSGLVFCIDPGHGGNNPANDRRVEPDPGNVFWESESNFQKALLLKPLLEERGATVLLTRETNYYPNNDEPSLAARVAFANANNADWFHSIHSNATGWASNTTVNYTLMLVREQIVPGGDPVYGPGAGVPEWPEAYAVSDLIGPAITAKLRTTPRSKYTYLDYTFYGTYTLGVLRGLIMPGELSEGSFHDNFPETRRLLNNSYRKMEAYALRAAFLQYFGTTGDTLGIVAGIQRDNASGSPVNFTHVRLLPLGRVVTGDGFNNGFYLFDGLPEGTYTLRYETAGYLADSVVVTLGRGATVFVDRQLESFAFPSVSISAPVDGDTLFPANLPIVLSFSKPMTTASVGAAFSIVPPTAGTFTWSNNNSVLTFQPDSVLPFYVDYTVRVDTSARSSGGQPFDGNGDGSPGDPFVLRFRTLAVDGLVPGIISSSIAEGAVLPAPLQMLNFTFDEPLNPATVITPNLVLGEIGGLIPFRALEYSLGNLRGGVSMYVPSGLQSGKSYRMLITRVADTAGNVIPTSPALLWTFSVAPEGYTFTTIDSLNGSSAWKQPGESPFTAGLSSGDFSYSTDRVFPFLFSGRGSARLRYAWDTTAASQQLEILADSAARTIEWTGARTILRAHLHGDGSGTEFRFAVEDSVESYPGGPPEHREVSRWIPIDWAGWRAIDWRLDSDTAGVWTGDGILQGRVRLRGLQFRKPVSGVASGTLYVAGIEIAEQVVVSAEATSPGIPGAYALHQNFPNPFNPSTRIQFDLPRSAEVTMGVFDVLGRKVVELLDAPLEAGRHEVEWNTEGAGVPVASGVYVVRFLARGAGGEHLHSSALKIVLLK